MPTRIIVPILPKVRVQSYSIFVADFFHWTCTDPKRSVQWTKLIRTGVDHSGHTEIPDNEEDELNSE